MLLSPDILLKPFTWPIYGTTRESAKGCIDHVPRGS